MRIRIFLLITCIIRTESEICDETCIVSPLAEFNNKQVNDFVLWSDVKVESAVGCVSKCSFDFRCVTAGYSLTSAECRGYAVLFTTPEVTSYNVSSGARMYPLCRGQNGIGSSCIGSSDCEAPHSTCLDGQCVCDIGYSFTMTGLLRCVPNCLEYGTTFRKYDTQTVMRNNDKTVNSVTEEECTQACIQETGFDCKSAEYDKLSRTCQLMKVSWLDLPESDKNINPTWSFHTRNCLY